MCISVKVWTLGRSLVSLYFFISALPKLLFGKLLNLLYSVSIPTLLPKADFWLVSYFVFFCCSEKLKPTLPQREATVIL